MRVDFTKSWIKPERYQAIGWIEKNKLWGINLVQMIFDDTHNL